MYKCSSLHPDPAEIARVTDYIVAYACKGNETFVEERKQMKALIMGSTSVYGNSNDVKRIARKLLNKTSKDKVISKQECMCHVAKLNLFMCSESIETVSISGEYRLCTTGEAKYSFLTKYAKRDTAKWSHLSLHQYFHNIRKLKLLNNIGNQKCIIPHYVGARSVPTYPPTEGYAKSVLILHVPWNNTFNEQTEPRNYIEEFKSFIKSPLCPMSVKIGYQCAKARYEENKQFVEPTGKNENICYDTFSRTTDESVQEIVALASTYNLTHALDIENKNDFFCGDKLTDWSQQHYKVSDKNNDDTFIIC